MGEITFCTTSAVCQLMIQHFFFDILARDTGYKVNIILDGTVRPHTKRDTMQRRFKQTMNQINSFYCQHATLPILPGTDNKNEFYAVEASEIRKNEQNELCIQQQAQLLIKPTRRVALRSISDLM